MKLFDKNKEPEEQLLEDVVIEEDELFEEDLKNVLAGVPQEYARERLSELEQMMGEKKPTEETESKQK